MKVFRSKDGPVGWAGDVDEVLDAVHEHVTGGRPPYHAPPKRGQHPALQEADYKLESGDIAELLKLCTEVERELGDGRTSEEKVAEIERRLILQYERQRRS